MAFDYTKKANYHYIDLSDIDESLLNHPLYPNRTGKEKNALYFADKAFLYEAYLSRFAVFSGVKINEKSVVPTTSLPVSISSTYLKEEGDLILYDNLLKSSSSTIPSNTSYSSADTAISSEIKYAFSKDYKGNAYSSRAFFFSLGNYNLSFSLLANAIERLGYLKNYNTSAIDVGKVLDGATYSPVYITGNSSSYNLDNKSVIYYMKETSEDQGTSFEGYTVRNKPFYTIDTSAAITANTSFSVYALVRFTNTVDTTIFKFVDIGSETPVQTSKWLIEIGKGLLPAMKGSDISYHCIQVSIEELFLFATHNLNISI